MKKESYKWPILCEYHYHDNSTQISLIIIDLYDYWVFVGMAFETMEDVEKFYKAYAHNVAFSIRIEQKRVVDIVVV